MSKTSAPFNTAVPGRSRQAALGRVAAVCLWAVCVLLLDCRPAGAQTAGGYERAAAVRIPPEPTPPVRLLGIDAFDTEDVRWELPSQDRFWQPFEAALRPAASPLGEMRLLSADVPPAPGLIKPDPHNEFHVDNFEPPLSFRDDLHCCLPVLRDDAVGLVNWNNAAILGVSLAAAIGIHQDLDDRVRENTARHPQRWSDFSKTLGRLGEPQYQLPVWLGVYAYSLHEQDRELHAMTGSLLSAYTLSGVSTITIKVIANTDRPSSDWNGGQYGFPSFHTSSSFSIAAVLDEYYGPKVGLPAYALAGLIGWSRIDERDHDLSDVVFGAALGYVIGKSVARRHLHGDSRVRLLPYTHPAEGTCGLMLDVAF